MKYYIIQKETGDFNIVKVLQADEANFLEDYGHLAVAAGPSIYEALIQFAKLKENK